jgi:hypothetical protein
MFVAQGERPANGALSLSTSSNRAQLPWPARFDSLRATEYPFMTQEQVRLAEGTAQTVAWKKFGPYLTERQWDTVREDYSSGRNAWNYITHDMARR